MRIEIILDSSTKKAAQNQALFLGYSSLAALLKVMAASLAYDYRRRIMPAGGEFNEGKERAAPRLAAVRADQPLPREEPDEPLPPAEQFSKWPPFFGPEAIARDPELYRLLVQTGQIS